MPAHFCYGADAPGPDQLIAGPIPAELVEVIDGDTIRVDAYPWPLQTVRTRVRFPGIQAPESGRRAKCDREARLADAATAALTDIMAAAGSRRLTLLNVRHGTYAGRVLADVRTADGTDVSKALLAAGVVVPWDYPAPRPDFCK